MGFQHSQSSYRPACERHHHEEWALTDEKTPLVLWKSVFLSYVLQWCERLGGTTAQSSPWANLHAYLFQAFCLLLFPFSAVINSTCPAPPMWGDVSTRYKVLGARLREASGRRQAEKSSRLDPRPAEGKCIPMRCVKCCDLADQRKMIKSS